MESIFRPVVVNRLGVNTFLEQDVPFCVFAIRVCSDGSVGQRKLEANRFYYLLDGFQICEDKVLVSKQRFALSVFDYYFDDSLSSPHVSLSAIVGENGSGKSSLIEYELRLINNFSSVIFGESPKTPKGAHLHFISGMDGEMYYLHKKSVLRLKVFKRRVSLDCFYLQDEEENGYCVFKQSSPSVDLLAEWDGAHQKGTQPITVSDDPAYFENLKQILSRFFYTIVLNQSVYAYNTNDFREECNCESYEIKVRHGRKKNESGARVDYSFEDKCWLNGLFHKNDGYQIPLVLSPYRYQGNYDINTENRLAYERLISIMVRGQESDRIINGHLKVTSFRLEKKDCEYDMSYIRKKIGFGHFSNDDFNLMSSIILETWSGYLGYDLQKDVKSVFYKRTAINYLVYKTLKIAHTYEEYRDFDYKFNTKKQVFDAKEFKQLVERTISNYSHVTNKLHRTVAYLLWDIYDVQGKGENKEFDILISTINEKCNEVFNTTPGLSFENTLLVSVFSEAAIPPPFFRSTLGLVDMETGGFVPFEYLSSGEKQQAYTISSLVYHLKNLDSVHIDKSTEERVCYDSVRLILEEVELYYHPELQRLFIRHLLDGIKRANLSYIKWVDICVVSHSPFVISDIPTSNVLALKKDNVEVGSIPCFGANIHDMLKLSFFLEHGTIGAFARWTITRLAICLKVSRWLNGLEQGPSDFESLVKVSEEYAFLKEYSAISEDFNPRFDEEAFRLVYSPGVILSQINLVEEPVFRRVLLDDFKRTFPQNKEEYKNAMLALLNAQEKAIRDL